MDVILLQDLEKVGEKHEIVNVKDGYGRNYLIPQGFALMATKSNRKRLNEMRRQEEVRQEKEMKHYQDIADQLNGVILKIGAKTGTSGKIFGSVTNVQIAEALKEQQDLDIERRDIELVEEVKTLGTYTAQIDLHSDVDCKVMFEVVDE